MSQRTLEKIWDDHTGHHWDGPADISYYWPIPLSLWSTEDLIVLANAIDRELEDRETD